MRTVIAIAALMALASVGARAAELTNLLANPGFEDGAEGWTPNGEGFVVDTDRPHSGASCIRLDKPEGVTWVGAMQEIVLDQQAATPIVAWAWCRSQDVVEVAPSTFCIYLDLEFQQDTRPGRVDLPGQTVAFASGTQDWHYRELIISPEHPIKSIKYYLLFRNQPSGTAWLDDAGLAAVSSGPLAGGPEDLPPLPDDILSLTARSILASEPADSWQVFRSGDGLEMPGQARSLPAAPEHLFSATWLSPIWRGEVPPPEPPEAGMALHFMRRWERRSLMADHGGPNDGVLCVALPAGERVAGVELREWDVRHDAVALHGHEGRVVMRVEFSGDETPDRLLVRLEDEPFGTPDGSRIEVGRMGSEAGLRLGFGPEGGLWQVTSRGVECADYARLPGGLFVGALDEGVLHQVGGDVRVTDDSGHMLMSLKPQELQVEAELRESDGCVLVTGEVRDMRGVDRAVDVLFTLPVAAEGWRWHGDILSATDLNGETSVETTEYPLAAITRQDGSAGLGIALDPELPVDFRLGFDPARHRFYLRLKMGVSPDHKLQGRAPFSFLISPVDPRWGMRDLLAKWYAAYPAGFERRAMNEGCWLFAIAPSKVPNLQDYGYYEGSQDTDLLVEHGVVPCPYIIPVQRSLRPLDEMPAGYDEAMAVFEAFDPALVLGGPLTKDMIVNCRVMTADGRYPIRIRDDVGADIKPAKPVPMVVFSTSPDPELPQPNVGQFTLEQVRTMVGNEPRIGGIYIDSCAGWVARYRNVRREHFACADYPLSYDDQTGELSIDGRFSVVEFLRALGEQLHPEGRVVFPNLSSGRGHCWSYFACDVCGLEGRNHDITSVAFFRSMAATKPTLRLDYLAVGGQDTSLATREGLEEYFRNCTTWGVYPSIGRRCDEAYAQHRDLFEAYMPALRAIGAAGWQPVTHVRVEGAEGVIIERFGPAGGRLYLTVLNPGDGERTGRLVVDRQALGVSATGEVRDLLTGAKVALDGPVPLAPRRLMVLEVPIAGD